MQWKIFLLFYLFSFLFLNPGCNSLPERFTNTLGINFVRIESGKFKMGQDKNGDFDEKPVSQVEISQPFLLAITEITNQHYEQFDPDHKKWRGHHELSNDDNDAVVNVSWHEAMEFCQWLSEKEGINYRLPTEAEWEYACRAGTETSFSTGDTLPDDYQKSQKDNWIFNKVSLKVATTPANPWGLYDMHGNVEEWCLDWYGPYEENDQTDPTGRSSGDFKVTRGGSHNTNLAYLRSANRAGTLPADRSVVIGFRLVQADQPDDNFLPVPRKEKWAENVNQNKWQKENQHEMNKPFFAGPDVYVKIPENSKGPLFSRHNHCPALDVCPNGDVMAVWYTTITESGRELALAASRWRYDTKKWDPAAPFWDAPDRNDHATALWWDGENALYHFNGLSSDATWGKLALIMRTSLDNGVTWSQAEIINPVHGLRNMPIAGVMRTEDGSIVLKCDAVTGGHGGTAIHISKNGGKTWTDPGAGQPKPDFKAGKKGGWIAGIHGGVVELKDGRLLAFGRGDPILNKMPQSVSVDMGKTWDYSASPFPTIGGGQRLALMRLNEGPIMLVSFTDNSSKRKNRRWDAAEGMYLTTRGGKKEKAYGMFAALSFDEGKTWPIRKLITTDTRSQSIAGGGHTLTFTLDRTHAEPMGYLAVSQGPDGLIHLISSANHYRFNLAWLTRYMKFADFVD